MSVFDLESWLNKAPSDAILLDSPAGQFNGHMLLHEIKKITIWLRHSGLKRGDYCGFQDLNPQDSFLLILACVSLGIVAVPLNPKFRGEHLQPYLQQIPPCNLFIEGQPSWHQHQLGSADQQTALTIDLNAPAVVIFTSGSSGQAKGVLHSWSSLQAAAQGSLEFYQIQGRWSWLLSLGLFHIGGLMIGIRTLLGLGCFVIPNEGMSLAEAISKHRPDWLSLVPTQLDDLLQEPEIVALLQKCQGLVIGGAAASESCLKRAFDLGLKVSLSYGSSETAAQLTATRLGKRPSNLNAAIAGFPLPGRQVQLDEASQLIGCRGSVLFQGYWLNRQFFSHPADQWFQTSDLGRWTDDGLQILGRIDDVFMCGGEGLSRSEIQRVIDSMASGMQAVVVKLADARLGWIPVLYIEAPARPDLTDLLLGLQEKLPSIKRPRRIYWRSNQKFFLPGQKVAIAHLEAQLAQLAQTAKGSEIELLWRIKADS